MEQVGDIDVKTTGTRPVATTAFSMLCKQQLNANGCTPGKYIELVEHMLAAGANVNKQDHRGNTCIMMAAGCANEAVLRYFVERAASLGEKGYDWNIKNQDGKNVYDLVGKPEGGKRHGTPTAIFRLLDVLRRDGTIGPNVARRKKKKRRKGEREKGRSGEREKCTPEPLTSSGLMGIHACQ